MHLNCTIKGIRHLNIEILLSVIYIYIFFKLTCRQDWFDLHIPQDTAPLSLEFEETTECNEDVFVLLVHYLQVPTEYIHKSKRYRTDSSAMISTQINSLWHWFQSCFDSHLTHVFCVVSTTCHRDYGIILMSFYFAAWQFIIVACKKWTVFGQFKRHSGAVEYIFMLIYAQVWLCETIFDS